VNLHWRQSRFISGAHKFTVEAPKALAKHRGDLEVRGRFPRIFFKIYAILTYVFYGAFLASSVYFWRGRYSSGPRFLLGSSPSLSPTSGLTHGVAPWTALAGRGAAAPYRPHAAPTQKKILAPPMGGTMLGHVLQMQQLLNAGDSVASWETLPAGRHYSSYVQ